MKEFLLRRFLALKKLYIIDQQYIKFPVFVSERPGLLLVDGCYKFVRKHLRRDIENLFRRIFSDDMYAYGLHQMCLAKAGSAIDKQRIICFSRCLGYRQRYGMSKLIALADYKAFKVKARIEKLLQFQVGIIIYASGSRLCTLRSVLILRLYDDLPFPVRLSVDSNLYRIQITLFDMLDQSGIIGPR